MGCRGAPGARSAPTPTARRGWAGVPSYPSPQKIAAQLLKTGIVRRKRSLRPVEFLCTLVFDKGVQLYYPLKKPRAGFVEPTYLPGASPSPNPTPGCPLLWLRPWIVDGVPNSPHPPHQDPTLPRGCPRLRGRRYTFRRTGILRPSPLTTTHVPERHSMGSRLSVPPH
jgi:hypothetical protein